MALLSDTLFICGLHGVWCCVVEEGLLQTQSVQWCLLTGINFHDMLQLMQDWESTQCELCARHHLS